MKALTLTAMTKAHGRLKKKKEKKNIQMKPQEKELEQIQNGKATSLGN